jgi:hypothetical protein
MLGPHNPPRSVTGTWAPPLSGGTIAPCVDSLLCFRSLDGLSLSPRQSQSLRYVDAFIHFTFELSLLLPRLACSLHLKVIMRYR